MGNDREINYKGFNKDLTKEDLNEEELECYNKLMEGISEASLEEKEEVAHLMDIFVETDEETYTHCVRCNKEFINTMQSGEEKRIYCDDCLKKMWGSMEQKTKY